jgi:hypothetical protein
MMTDADDELSCSLDLGFESGGGRTHIWVHNLTGFSRARQPFQQKKYIFWVGVGDNRADDGGK